MRKSRWWVPDAETIASRLQVPLEDVQNVMTGNPGLERNEDGEYYIPQFRYILNIGPKSRKAAAERDVPRTLRDVHTYDDARLLGEMKKVELAQLRIDQVSGKLVAKADVERSLAGLASAVRSVLSAAPSRHAALLSARFTIPLHDIRMELDKIFDEVGDNLKTILTGGR